MQWGGRTHFLLAIVRRINEVIRYPHYTFNCVGTCPSWITYLRHTTFIVLYPIGFDDESFAFVLSIPLVETLPAYVQAKAVKTGPAAWE